MNIEKNISNVRLTLPDGVRLVVVTKTQPQEKILEAYGCGHREFGENKVQELVFKHDSLPKDINWHMIGHLQTNKVKYIAPFVSLIHSIDSYKLLKEVNKQAARFDRIIKCLLQVHIATEETKFGLSESELYDLIQSGDLKKLKHIKIKGLMGMATFTDDTSRVKKEFSALKNLMEKVKATGPADNIDMTEISMGMSGDYLLAIEEGSTIVRIGSTIFGAREK
jgi:pyridoxal phosphate enzyme (YggS family)